MGFLSVLSFAQKMVKKYVHQGERVIDATMGTGVDTLFLAQLSGTNGAVAAFDVQPQAIALTDQRLQRNLGVAGSHHVRLYTASHTEMMHILPTSWHSTTAAIMFNLGYLATVDADKRVITKPATTLKALEVSMKLLRTGGVLSIVVYSGHAGGELEAEAVDTWASNLSPLSGQAIIYRMLQRPEAPYLIVINKK